MIDKNSIVKCPWCGKGDTLEKWNDNTYKECTNREMKRDYMQLTDERAFRKNSVSFYKCPICSKWTRGNQLILISKQPNKMEQLGGEPLVKSISNKTD